MYIVSSILAPSTFTESELIAKASAHNGLESLNLSEWRALSNILHRNGFSREANIIDRNI